MRSRRISIEKDSVAQTQPMYGSADRCRASWVDRKLIVPIKIKIPAFRDEANQEDRFFAILAVYNKKDHLKPSSLIDWQNLLV